MAVRRPPASRLGALIAFAAITGCGEPTPPPALLQTTVGVSATLTPEQREVIRAMSVEVSGAGITVPVVVTLDVAGAAVNGTVRVPVGTNRTFLVRAFDAQAVETHSGSATASVRAGTNPTLGVRLAARAGDVPIDVSIGSYTLSLSPSPLTVARGGSATLTATVREVGGGVVAGPELQWGARNPVIAQVAAGAGGTATVSGGVAGWTTVEVSWRGIAASVDVTVTP